MEEQLSAQRIAFVIGKPALAEELACADGDEIRTRDEDRVGGDVCRQNCT